VTHDGARFDLAVIGSGIAGLYAALQAHEHGLSVLVVTKGSIDEANTRYAQGGIAAAVGHDDSPDSHWRDTVAAGAGLVDEQAARVLTAEAADRIADLVRYGVRFDATDGEVALGREAAHSAPRILHAGGDATGLEIELSLAGLARREGVTVVEHTLASALLVEHGSVTGIDVFDWRALRTDRVHARAVVLATGGAGQLFRITTNPDVATGDGIALAYRAGAEVTDLEFTQFHPTALVIPGKPVFLISEAVRGEGALLYNTRGERFMPRYHPLAELAPRDVVARAATREMAATGADHVLLDITGRDPGWLAARFPQIYARCAEADLDLARDRIPVSPAAHYTMGGVRTDTWGRTTLAGLYAVGEVACTGVHGANRLASNSLLETVIFAKRAVQHALECMDETIHAELAHPAAAAPAASASPSPRNGERGPGGEGSPPRAGLDLDGAALTPTPDARPLPPPTPDGPPPTAADLRELMWTYVGIERDRAGLEHATRTLARWDAALAATASSPSPPQGERGPGGEGSESRATHELRALVTCARLAAEAALLREESRGAHYRTDFPEPREEWRRHLVWRAG
jgi:L-aspartate oxidase